MNLEKKLSASTFLFAVLAMSSFAGLGLAGAALATVGGGNATNNTSSSNATTTAPAESNATATASSNNASSIGGVIASIQTDESGRPAWITAGHWKLESDTTLVGGGSENATEARFSNFTATLYMVSIADGTEAHVHKVSNFSQTAVQHQGVNSTTVNGTFTVNLQEGSVINNVRGYINIINDKIEFWVDPVATDNHFGPTAITGVVLDPEKIREHMKAEEDGMMTMTQGANNTASWQ